MRITSGSARNLRLQVPPDEVRPSTDRVREAVFSMLGDWILGKVVLDLYAGSGAYGLEALSRGAASACFVERDRQVAEVLESNIGHCKCSPSDVSVRVQSVESFLSSSPNMGPFDLVFADPPYRLSEGGKLLQNTLQALGVGTMVNPDGFVLYEQRKNEAPVTVDEWELVRDRSYGLSRILLYRRKG